jgi:hypothetical protein
MPRDPERQERRVHLCVSARPAFLTFVGVDPETLKKQVAAGKTDGEILQWIETNSSRKPSAGEILAWSMAQEQRGPTDVDSRDYFNETHKKNRART